jgi:hypothetical protein
VTDEELHIAIARLILSHRRKLARAELHIENVEAMLSGWLRNGYRTFEQPNSEGRFEVLAEQLKPLPDQISLAVGDALQCLRNSLDHLVWELATKQTPTMTPDQERKTQFPIAEATAIPLTDSRIRCVSPAVADEICALAPDPGRKPLNQDPLWLLNKVNNRDKHREVAVVALASGPTGYSLIASDGTDYFHAFGRQRLQLGAAPVTLVEYARSPGVKAEIRLSTEVVFDQGIEVADRQVVPTLRWFHDYIRDTVFKRLEPHL